MARRGIIFLLFVFEFVIILVSAATEIKQDTDDWGRCKLSEERPHICPGSKACCSFAEYCVHGHCESCFGEIKDVTSWCRENQSINQFPDYECRYACNEILKSENNVIQSTTPAINTTQDAKYQQLKDKEEKNVDTRNNDSFSVLEIIQASALFFFLTYYFIKEFLKCKKAKGNQQAVLQVEGQPHQLNGDNNTGSSDNTGTTMQDDSLKTNTSCINENETTSTITGNVYQSDVRQSNTGNAVEKETTFTTTGNVLQSDVRQSNTGNAVEKVRQSNTGNAVENETTFTTSAAENAERSRNTFKYNDSTTTNNAATEKMARNFSNFLESMEPNVSETETSAQTSVSEQKTKQPNEPPTMSDNKPIEMDDNDDDAYVEATARVPLLRENYTAGNDDYSRDPVYNKKATSTLQKMARNTGAIDSSIHIRNLGSNQSQETTDVKDEEIKHS